MAGESIVNMYFFWGDPLKGVQEKRCILKVHKTFQLDLFNYSDTLRVCIKIEYGYV